MRNIKFSIVIILIVSFNACAQTTDLQKVNFLIGTWKIEGKENYETWQKTDNQLNGESYKIRNGQKYVSEKLEIKLVDNYLVYIATVFNQNEGKGIPFKFNPSEENLFSFENLFHDFPKKIQYKILNKDELFVSVLGEENKGFSYKLIRQSD